MDQEPRRRARRLLYVGVGSNSNVGEHGLGEERERAAIWRVDPRTGRHSLYATGLAILPRSSPAGHGYAVCRGERARGLGSDLVPDYLTRVQAGGFYGWPWSYYGGHIDTRVRPRRPDMMRRALVPDYALGAHVAPLGIAFSQGQRLGPAFANGVFVALHGSWNRRPLSGYRVAFVRLEDGQPAGDPFDVLAGFVTPNRQRAMGRPVGVAVGRDGSLLVADDVGGRIWRVSARALGFPCRARYEPAWTSSTSSRSEPGGGGDADAGPARQPQRAERRDARRDEGGGGESGGQRRPLHCC